MVDARQILFVSGDLDKGARKFLEAGDLANGARRFLDDDITGTTLEFPRRDVSDDVTGIESGKEFLRWRDSTTARGH